MAEQGDKNNEISDDAKKLDALADMIRDACSKMDDGVKRMDARMDAIEDSQKRFDARMDAAKKDEDEDEKRDDSYEDEKREDARKDEDEDEKRDDSDEDEKREDTRRKDARKDAAKKDEDEDEKRDDSDEDEKRDDSDEDEDEKVADYAPISKAEAAELRAQIARLQARAPAIITDAERDRFAAVQEQAEPAFQAFGDRAPAPLQGETVTQYKRRLGSKMQVHSTKWKDARLSAVSDEFMLDAVLDDIYADSLAAARRGVDVPVGQLRARERSSGGHTIIEYEGYADSWMNGFAGNSQRGTGNWLRPH
jgi:cobalamin biosynthesis protein CobT